MVRTGLFVTQSFPRVHLLARRSGARVMRTES